MTAPITHLQALEYHEAVAKILDLGDMAKILGLREALGLPPPSAAINSTPPTPPDFCYSQVEAAKIVCAALGLELATFRANKPWLLLERKGLGEGLGFETRGPRTRVYTKEAVNYLVSNWGKTRWAKGKAELRVIRSCPAP